ncbi:hypothetical protein DFH29DRAFT_922742 [Suillus ampliporus]|nr:hypothetical protein DFH29DRAFT_922742 [Suillus ampliporus]
MNFSIAPCLTLSPTADSCPFEAIRLSFTSNVRIPLGPGAFTPGGSLSLASPHVEIWLQNKQVGKQAFENDGGTLKDALQVLIRDQKTARGTYVNGIRIVQQTLLQNGDILTLGVPISRCSGVPVNVTNDQLRPIKAIVTIVGV